MHRFLPALLAPFALTAIAQTVVDIGSTDVNTVVNVNGTKVSPPAPAAMVTAWIRASIENEPISVSGSTVVRFGDGLTWVTKTISSPGTCSVSFFGSDPKPGTYKFCEYQVTVPAVVQTPGMPVINKALIARSSIGYNSPRVRQLSAAELANPSNQPTPSTQGGAFREPCANFSHISGDDPMVFPGQPEASHTHTFIGNDQANANSTPTSIATTGNSTCAGGTLNRTAYWMPSLIDIRTGQVLVPLDATFYYKGGYLGVKPGTIKTFPKGLRMIAGNSKNTLPITDRNVGVECVSGGGHQQQIPSCAVGDLLNVSIIFPQCWDGVNLDSPDHKSHMAYAIAPNGCPATHPVPFPEIALNVHYKISEANSASFLRFSSDMYVGPGGYSLHADWFGGWDPATNKAWVDNCLNKSMDCHAYLLGDGRTLY